MVIYIFFLYIGHLPFQFFPFFFRNAGSSTVKPSSPTLKKVFDFDVTITSKSSPKRKTFAEGMPWDVQNTPKETSSPKRKTIRD